MWPKFKQYFLICSFYLGLALIISSLLISRPNDSQKKMLSKGQIDRSPEDSYFKGVIFFHQINSLPFVSMNADEMAISENLEQIFGQKIFGMYYGNFHKTPLSFQSERAQSYPNKNLIVLEENVFVENDIHKLWADKVEMFGQNPNQQKIIAEGKIHTTSIIHKNKSITFEKNTLDLYSQKVIFLAEENLLEYSGFVHGKIKRVKSYEQSVDIATDFLQLNGNEGLIDLKGNVKLKKEQFFGEANNGQVYLENYNKKLKYYTLYDDVKLKETIKLPNREIERRAFAEKLEGHMSERKVILTGFPKVLQENDVIKGNRIVLRENASTIEIDDANSSLILK